MSNRNSAYEHYFKQNPDAILDNPVIKRTVSFDPQNLGLPRPVEATQTFSEKDRLHFTEITVNLHTESTQQLIRMMEYVPPQETETEGKDATIIIIGGGASAAEGTNSGLAIRAIEALNKAEVLNPTSKLRVRNVIILPQPAGQPKTGEFRNKTNFDPDSAVLHEAMKQAGLKIMDSVTVIGYSAGGALATHLTEKLQANDTQEKNTQPKEYHLVALDPGGMADLDPSKIAWDLVVGSLIESWRKNKQNSRGLFHRIARTIKENQITWASPHGVPKVLDMINDIFDPHHYYRELEKAYALEKVAKIGPSPTIIATDSTKDAREKIKGKVTFVTPLRAKVVPALFARLKDQFQTMGINSIDELDKFWTDPDARLKPEQLQEIYDGELQRMFPQSEVKTVIYRTEAIETHGDLMNEQVIWDQTMETVLKQEQKRVEAT